MAFGAHIWQFDDDVYDILYMVSHILRLFSFRLIIIYSLIEIEFIPVLPPHCSSFCVPFCFVLFLFDIPFCFTLSFVLHGLHFSLTFWFWFCFCLLERLGLDFAVWFVFATVLFGQFVVWAWAWAWHD